MNAKPPPDDDAENVSTENQDFLVQFGAELHPEHAHLYQATLTPQESRRLLHQALDGIPFLCEGCGQLCPDHLVKVRDALFARGERFTQQLQACFHAYNGCRGVGVAYPGELLVKVSDNWMELHKLFFLVTALDRIAEQQEPDFDGLELELEE